MFEDYPLISLPLLQRLDQLFPEKCPAPEHEERRIWMDVGARKVIRHLIENYNAQHPEEKYKG